MLDPRDRGATRCAPARSPCRYQMRGRRLRFGGLLCSNYPCNRPPGPPQRSGMIWVNIGAYLGHGTNDSQAGPLIAPHSQIERARGGATGEGATGESGVEVGEGVALDLAVGFFSGAELGLSRSARRSFFIRKAKGHGLTRQACSRSMSRWTEAPLPTSIPSRGSRGARPNVTRSAPLMPRK
jgi:hypothetical protein